MAIISYDEKPGIQAIATTAPDLPPEPGVHASFAREHEYKRHGTVSLLAGIDLVTGKVHALVKDRHRSREFIEFLKLLDAAYPAETAIKVLVRRFPESVGRRRPVLRAQLGSRWRASAGPTPRIVRGRIIRAFRIGAQVDRRALFIPAVLIFGSKRILSNIVHKDAPLW